MIRRVACMTITAWGVGCATPDVGQSCPDMTVPFESHSTIGSDVAQAQSPEAVEFNVTFPCEHPVCVLTLGHEPYCSKECTHDGQCPTGFACRPVMTVGPFAGVQFCVWKPCNRDTDCGDPWEYGCEVVPELSLEFETRLCRRRE